MINRVESSETVAQGRRDSLLPRINVHRAPEKEGCTGFGQGAGGDKQGALIANIKLLPAETQGSSDMGATKRYCSAAGKSRRLIIGPCPYSHWAEGEVGSRGEQETRTDRARRYSPCPLQTRKPPDCCRALSYIRRPGEHTGVLIGR